MAAGSVMKKLTRNLSFILLRACCGYGGVGDEREVVAEERSAYNYSRQQCHVELHGLCQSGGDGYKSHDCSDARANRQTDEACGNEQSGQHHIAWQQREHGVHCGVDGSYRLCRVGKGASQYEYPQHRHNVRRTGSAAEYRNVLLQVLAACYSYGVYARDHERYAYRHFIEVAGYY